jgi:hypothetical protein
MGMIVAPHRFGAGAPTGHRYWRILSSSNSYGGSNPNQIVVGEVEMREAPGGDVCTGGTASADSQPFGGFEADKAFDNNGDSTAWAGADNAGPTHWLKYDFGVGNPKSIVEVAIMGKDDGGNTLTQCFGAFEVQWSDDNSAWTTEWSVSYPGGSNGHGYVANTFKVFTKP